MRWQFCRAAACAFVLWKVSTRGTAPSRRTGLRSLSAVLAFAVFLLDVMTPLQGAVPVLYLLAILLAAKTNWRDNTSSP